MFENENALLWLVFIVSLRTVSPKAHSKYILIYAIKPLVMKRTKSNLINMTLSISISCFKINRTWPGYGYYGENVIN